MEVHEDSIVMEIREAEASGVSERVVECEVSKHGTVGER